MPLLSYGRDAAVWVHGRLQEIIEASGREDATVRYFEHAWAQPSVVARVEGRSNTTVILSTHLDSLNLHLPMLLPAPGANDNAAGVAALLSVFHTLLTPPSGSETTPLKFANTLEFHFYSAEEAGFWGSTDVFANYNQRHMDIHSVLQFDMIGGPPSSHNNNNDKNTNNGKPGEIMNREMGIVTDFVHSNYIQYIKLLANEYTSINAVETVCGYACSDHAAAIRFGYPGGLMTGGRLEESDSKDKTYSGGDYSHTADDTVEKLDKELIGEFVRFGVAWGVELGFAELNTGGDGGWRGYTCDNGYPDGWMGSVRRFSAARAADPAGFGLWILVLLVMLGVARPWEEFPVVMGFGRRVRRGVRTGYARLSTRERVD
ncbi:Leucine aminopeptidase 1 [Orbilia blumenaviensis]|uniref:Peptide hydrolase n=1 Tax=Orbilia blumenaviensis TaxID=1796055 RepID=A0AAV9UMA8_9PEZI